jgi:polysaccharide pyruvyl transferase WcaK-like protein
MFRHLRRMDAILVRETISHGYLRDHGLIRLHRVADPAFAMDPTPPAGVNAHITIPNGAIGVNLSPLMASYVTGGNIITWERQCADIIRSIADATRRPIVLVPHVMTPNGDDHSFLVRVASLFSAGAAPVVLPRDLSAAELKYLISRCVVFAGARTHSTIAGLSSLVPTLSFAYSIKAYGLNQDIYGSQEFCLKPGELTPSVVTERLVFMLANCEQIRARLADRLPDVIADAYKAGPVLRETLEARGYRAKKDAPVQ